MKKMLLLAVALTGFVCMGFTQNQVSAQGKLQSLKIAFLTQKLNLSPEEAQKFWPVFNNYESELKKTRQEMKVKNDDLATEEQIIIIRKKYRDIFSGIIGKERAARVYPEEKLFNKYVQKELQERRQKRRPEQ